MQKGKKKKLFTITYILLMLVSLITAFGYSMIATLISSYAVTLGAGLTVAGTLAGIYSLSALAIRPFGGMAADILNKKNMCIFATVMISASMAGYAVAPNMPVIFFFRILHGVAFGLSGTANMALVAEYIPEERMGEGLGYFGLGQVLSQVCGPSVGMAVKNQFGYKTLFLIIAAITILAVVVLLFIRYEKCPDQKAAEERKKLTFDNLIAKECIVYALIGGLFSLGNGVVNSFLVMLGDERSIINVALFFSVNAAILFMMRLGIGKIIDRTNLTFIVNISLAFTAISMIVIGGSFTLTGLIIAAVLKAVGQGGGQISLQSACIKRVDAVKIGIATSTYFIGADIGQGLGPIIGGKISDAFGYRAMYYCMGGLMIAGIFVFDIYQKRISQKINIKENRI